MGQQQLLLVILGLIIVGLSVAVGIGLFQSESDHSEKEAIIIELYHLAENAKAYFMKPATLGGGGFTYTGYSIPKEFQSSRYATYTCTTTYNRVFFTAVSKTSSGNTIEVTLGRYRDPLFNWTYTGAFH